MNLQFKYLEPRLGLIKQYESIVGADASVEASYNVASYAGL